MRNSACKSGPAKQALVALLCSLWAFTPACGPPPPEDVVPTASGGTDDFTEAGESAITYDRKGRAYESRFERIGRQLLQQRAAEPAVFEKLLAESFGEFDRTAAEGLRKKIMSDDFSWAPPVYLVGSETLGDQTGAYSEARRAVYLHEMLPSQYLRAHVYLEELGHHIETMLRVSDAPGDEGALFRLHVVGETYVPVIHDRFRKGEHRGSIVVDGQFLDVEFFGWPKWVENVASKVKSVGKKIGGWFGESATTVGAALRDYASKPYSAAKAMAEWVSENADEALEAWVETCKRQGIAYAQIAINAANTAYAMTRGYWEGATMLLEAADELRKGNFVAAGAAFGIALARVTVEIPVDLFVGITLETLAALQTALWLEPAGRFLRDDERTFLATVFGGPQWWFHVIRVKEGFAGVFSLMSKRAFTLESTIYLKNNPYTQQLLVHETTHAWQWFTGGGDYKIASLHEQYIKRTGYEFEGALNEGKSWAQLGVEQQANFVDMAFAQNCFANPQAMCWVNRTDRTAFFQGVRQALLDGRGAP